MHLLDEYTLNSEIRLTGGLYGISALVKVAKRLLLKTITFVAIKII